MRKEFVVMMMVKLLFSLMPLAAIQVNMILYKQLQLHMGAGDAVLTADVIFMAVSYVVFLLAGRLDVILYQRYFIQYGSLLKFEKKAKQLIHNKCGELSAESFLDPEIGRFAYEARVASINIYRIIEIGIDLIAALAGIISIGSYFLLINEIYLVLIALAVLPTLAEKAVEMLEHRKKQSELADCQRKEKALRESVLRPEFYKENRILNNFEFLIQKWKCNQEHHKKLEEKLSVQSLVIALCGGAVTLIGSLGGFLLAVYMLLQDGDFAHFTSVLIAFQSVQTFVGGIAAEYGYLTVFVTMVRPFFHLFDLKGREPKRLLLQKAEGDISLEQVSYEYTDNAVLRDVSFHIRKGERIAIVGRNGSGKSTLARILLGLYQPSEGKVTVGGVDLKDIPDSVKYTERTAVFQRPCRYPLTVQKNVSVSEPELAPQEERIRVLMEKVGLSYIEQGLVLGKELGNADLSGGEWQRLGIARGFYKECNFVVLDEPVSALDSLREKQMYDLFEELTREKSSVIITHRLGMAKCADRVVVMDKGCVAAIGTHEELLDNCSLYRQLWTLQSEEMLAY